MNVTAVVPGVHRIDLGLVNAYLCEDVDGLTLIDCGLSTSADDIRAAIAGLGRREEELRRLVLTHYHDDHRGAAIELRRGDLPRIFAYAADAAVVRGLEPQAEPDLTPGERAIHDRIVPNVPPAHACDVDVELLDGHEVDLLGGATIVGVPGHTPGSIALHARERGIVFTGDAVASVGGEPLVGFFNIDRDQARQSFMRLAALDFEVACPGHGDPIVHAAAIRLRPVAQRLEIRS